MKKPIEGELFKRLTLHGKTFELRYGYYEEFERESEFGEPIPIYPDFIKSPMYTDEGYPFVTQMQEACEWSENRKMPDACCADCTYFRHEDELIGLCDCEKRRRAVSPSIIENQPHLLRSEDTL